jgi:CRISPR-associated protein Cmr5
MTQQPQQSQQQTLQQQRAAHAWACIEKVRPEIQKKYGSLVRGLPALVQSDGLGQTLAFLLAQDGKSKNQGKTHHIQAYRNIADWLSKKYPEKTDLLGWIINTATTEQYRITTFEVLAYLSWLKRFAEAKGWKDEGADS